MQGGHESDSFCGEKQEGIGASAIALQRKLSSPVSAE